MFLKFKNVAWKCLTLRLIGQVAEMQTISFGAGSAFTALEFWKTRQAMLQWRWTFLQLQHHRPMLRSILSLWIVVFRAQKSYDQITDCESLFEDEYGHFAFTWCSVTDSEKEVNAKCLS